MTKNQKPRFTRVVKDGKMWLRDRQKPGETIGPFDSWADALGHMKKAEAAVDGESEVKSKR